MCGFVRCLYTFIFDASLGFAAFDVACSWWYCMMAVVVAVLVGVVGVVVVVYVWCS